MAVHDIDVNAVGAGLLGFPDLLSQAGKVGSQDRGCNFRHRGTP
jgi:hypothetical protein